MFQKEHYKLTFLFWALSNMLYFPELSISSYLASQLLSILIPLTSITSNQLTVLTPQLDYQGLLFSHL